MAGKIREVRIRMRYELVHRQNPAIPLIKITDIRQIRVVDYDDVARPYGRYATDGDQKKDS